MTYPRSETPAAREARLAAARARREHLLATTPPAAYTILEFCAAHRVSRTAAYELIRRGELEVVRLGKSVRVTPEAAARLIERSRVPTIAA